MDVSAFVEIETLLGRLDAASDRAIVRFATSRDDPRAVWEAEARPAQDQLSKRVGELVALEGAAFASARSQAAASRASAWYDNSPANKSNPDATKDVWWGDQTWEEMMFTSFTWDVKPPRTP